MCKFTNSYNDNDTMYRLAKNYFFILEKNILLESGFFCTSTSSNNPKF